jgi:TM2 domain-containing membrane protein YozV/RNA polymerase subunit RPABC4/transcription elongation factor Spt4
MQPNAVACEKCGAPVGQGVNYCPNCGQPTAPDAIQCPGCGAPLAPAPMQGGKSKIAAGLLGIFLGAFGIHRFYLGYTTIGIIQIIVTLVTCGVGSLWGFVEGILILCGQSITTDANGIPLSD